MNPVLPHLKIIRTTILESSDGGVIDTKYEHLSSAAAATATTTKIENVVSSRPSADCPIDMRGHRHEERTVQRSLLSILLNQHQEETRNESQSLQQVTSNAMEETEEEEPSKLISSPLQHTEMNVSPPHIVRSTVVAVDSLQQLQRNLETEMTERLQQVKLMDISSTTNTATNEDSQSSSTGTGVGVAGYSSRGGQSSNEARKSRRAQHHQAIIHDLTEIVTDLFLAESKLVNPSLYGVQSNHTLKREQVVKCVHDFIMSLPPRYALGAESPSEVLIHMRLMAAVRADPGRPSVHIANLDDDVHWMSAPITTTSTSSSAVSLPSSSTSPPTTAIDSTQGSSSTKRKRLVTICCADEHGLLEYISKILATGGSRVLDADVMLSTDSIVLDRFVVEMNGRLRLDKLAQYVGEFLERAKEVQKVITNPLEDTTTTSDDIGVVADQCLQRSQKSDLPTPLYFRHNNTIMPVRRCASSLDIIHGVTLQQALKEQSGKSRNLLSSLNPDEEFLPLSRRHTMLLTISKGESSSELRRKGKIALAQNDSDSQQQVVPAEHTRKIDDKQSTTEQTDSEQENNNVQKLTPTRPLVKRHGIADLDTVRSVSKNDTISQIEDSSRSIAKGLEKRRIPLIPFDELMLIETLGVGRVSTIYRAAWSPKISLTEKDSHTNNDNIRMVALKVAMVNPETHDTLHIQELHREFGIAACLQHPNISHLVGIAEDHDCFCLAYEYCEGGSLLSLVSDRRRCYEYLPIALDIVQGMAYLHARNVIHRDLKLSNILLDRDNRAKISDFGMSVAMAGQELTAETGTYRYMAPEVIRHESYSSNADVYSFGICLWQLITREVPFATMTPIQAAFRVAQGERPDIPESTPRPLKDIITACWEQDCRRRPSFTWIAMALYDYATSAFSPATVSAKTLQIANDMIASLEGNSTVNVDFSAPLAKTVVVYQQEDIDEDIDDDNNIGLEL